MTSRPPGSTATLSDATGPSVSFVADILGSYSLSVVASGSCSSSTTATYAAIDRAPLVALTTSVRDLAAFLQVPVTVSAASTIDPDGDPFTVKWSLSTPFPSKAKLDDASTLTAHFTPDVPGEYRVNVLTTSAGGATSGTAAVVRAVDRTLSTGLPAEMFGNAGRPVTLDGSRIALASGDPVIFAWALIERPQGSVAGDVVAPSEKQLAFTPDVPGTYRTRVQVTDRIALYTAEIPVTVWPHVDLLPYMPVDAEYDGSLDRLILVSEQPPALHILDAHQGSEVTVGIPPDIIDVGVSPDGKAAAVTHGAAISVVDLESATLITTWPISTHPPAANVTITDPVTTVDHMTRYAVYLPGDADFGAVHALDLTTGLDGVGTDIVAYLGGGLRALRGSNRVVVTDGVSVDPQGIFIVGIGPDGVPRELRATNAMSGNCGGPFWVSEDSTQLICQFARRFFLDTLASDAFIPTPGGMVWSAHAPAAPSPAAGRWLVQPEVNFEFREFDAHAVELDARSLANPTALPYPMLGIGSRALTLHGRVVWYDPSGRRHCAALIEDEETGAAAVGVFDF